MVGSGLGLAWSLVAVRRTNRTMDHDDDNDETLSGSTVNFLARLAEVGPRIILMALFATQHTFFAFVMGGLHWLVCSTWVFIIDKTKERKKFINIFLKILIGYPLIFCFVDLDYIYSETDRDHIITRYKMMMYYILFYTENWIMFSLWIAETDSASQWFYPASIVAVVCGMICHITFQILYYKVFHPNSNEISLCVPLSKASCLYHEDEDS